MKRFKYFNDFSFLISATKNSYVIFDSNVSYITPYLTSDFKLPIFISEDSKNMKLVLELASILVKNNFTRADTIIAIGGGCLLDIVGFLASIMFRGVKVVYIPTTLLSFVDACFGGKTGINFYNAKNILGSFKEPEEILISSSFLKSLSKDELHSGLGEVLKYYFTSSFTLDYKSEYPKLIDDCIRLKETYVKSDFIDLGLRQILNLGHTFGHVYELKYRLTHGSAVISGVRSILDLELDLKIIDEKEYNFYIAKFMEFLNYFNIQYQHYNYKEHLKLINLDKKNFRGVINFIFIKDAKAIIYPLSLNDLEVI